MGFHLGCGVILTQKDTFVLVQETRSFKAGLYNLPAGTPELNEDLLTCAQREAEEETGVAITLEHFIGIYQSVLGDGNNVLFFVFSAKVPESATFHSHEHTVIEALSYKEIESYNQQGKLRSPVVLKSIQDYRRGQLLPLNTIQYAYLDRLSTIAVEKGH